MVVDLVADRSLRPDSLAADERLVLLRTAREAIDHGLRHGKPPRLDPAAFPPPLLVERACFVSLHRFEELRGCVGSLEARLPLALQVGESAYAAAFCDPRLPPVAVGEIRDLTIEISVLSPLMPIEAGSQRALLDQLRPGIDGLVLREGGCRATFLPKVWETFPVPFDFVEHLKRKAGLPQGYWSRALRFERYTTESFGIDVAQLDSIPPPSSH